MADIDVRRAREEDADDIVELWKGFVEFLSPRDPRYAAREGAYEKWREYFLKRMLNSEHAALFVADTGSGLAGVVEARITGGHPVFRVDMHGHLYGHFVTAEHRGSGVGRRLIEAAEAWFREKGLPSYRITVLSFLPEVREAYEAWGLQLAEWEMEKQLS